MVKNTVFSSFIYMITETETETLGVTIFGEDSIFRL